MLRASVMLDKYPKLIKWYPALQSINNIPQNTSA